MAADISRNGRALVTDAEGRRLLLTSTKLLNLPGDEVMLAYEGRGAIFFKLDRPMNISDCLRAAFPRRPLILYRTWSIG
jgi:hypothetical protein